LYCYGGGQELLAVSHFEGGKHLFKSDSLSPTTLWLLGIVLFHKFKIREARYGVMDVSGRKWWRYSRCMK